MVFRTIDITTETNLSDADVIFSYNDRNLIDLKTFNLFSKESIKLEGKTGDDGIVVFENISYSLYSKLFHKSDLSEVIATGGCFKGDSIMPVFHNLKNRKEKLLKLPARSESLDFQVVDAKDKQPLPEADLNYSLSYSNDITKEDSKSDPHGIVEFQNIMFCSDKMVLIASKYGYKNDTLSNTVQAFLPNLQKRTLYLEPIMEMIEFTVKDLKSKQTVANATALLLFTNDTIKTTTNTNGVGKGAFEDVHIIEKIQIKVSHPSYHDTITKSYVVSDYVKLNKTERIIYIRPKARSYTFQNTDKSTGRALPGVKNEIFINGKSQGTQYSNAEGNFNIPKLNKDDKITIKSSKSNYYKNTTKVNNKKVSKLQSNNSRTIPLQKEPPPPQNIEPPRKNCRAHFAGTLLSDHSVTGHMSKIYVPDIYSEYVGEGEYPSNKAAFPKAVKYTFDGIAVDKGTRIIIYSKPNFQGSVLPCLQSPKQHLHYLR